MLSLKQLPYQTVQPLTVFFSQIVGLLLVYPVLQDLYFNLGQLSEEAYFEPIILVQLLQQPLSLLLPFLSLTIILFLGYRRLAWQNFEQGRVMRYFVFFLTAIIAWTFSTYDYNLYFDQPHYLDRFLLVALSLLTLWHPLFIAFFLIEAIGVGSQFEPPLRDFSWTDKAVVFNILILFHLCLYLKVFFKKQILVLFFFLALCLFAANYFISAVGKLELDWLRFNDMSGLLVNSYVNGWLAFLPEPLLLQIIDAFEPLNFLLLLVTLVIELASLVMFFRRRWAILILTGFILLHAVIFLTSGIFFWKWMLLALGFILALQVLRTETSAFLFSRPVFVASLLVIGLSPYYFNPTKLAWLDTNLNNSYELEAVGLSGAVYRVSRGFMSPYDLPFAQNRFYFLTDENLLVKTYGTTLDAEIVSALKIMQPGPDLAELARTKGKNYYHEQSSQRLEHFLATYFGNLNRRGSKTIFLNFFGAPHHIWNFAGGQTYQMQEPIRQIRIKFIQTLYDGQKIHWLRDETIGVVDVP